MKLTEQDEMKWFKLKVGLPCYPFDKPIPEKIPVLLPPSPVLYDHFQPGKDIKPLPLPGIHVFHVNDHDNLLDGKHFIFVPEGYEDEYIEGPIEMELEDGSKITKNPCSCKDCQCQTTA